MQQNSLRDAWHFVWHFVAYTTVSKAREQNHHWNDRQRGTIEARRV
jgi:hypothetical protein